MTHGNHNGSSHFSHNSPVAWFCSNCEFNNLAPPIPALRGEGQPSLSLGLFLGSFHCIPDHTATRPDDSLKHDRLPLPCFVGARRARSGELPGEGLLPLCFSAISASLRERSSLVPRNLLCVSCECPKDRCMACLESASYSRRIPEGTRNGPSASSPASKSRIEYNGDIEWKAEGDA